MSEIMHVAESRCFIVVHADGYDGYKSLTMKEQGVRWGASGGAYSDFEAEERYIFIIII